MIFKFLCQIFKVLKIIVHWCIQIFPLYMKCIYFVLKIMQLKKNNNYNIYYYKYIFDRMTFNHIVIIFKKNIQNSSILCCFKAFLLKLLHQKIIFKINKKIFMFFSKYCVAKTLNALGCTFNGIIKNTCGLYLYLCKKIQKQ